MTVTIHNRKGHVVAKAISSTRWLVTCRNEWVCDYQQEYSTERGFRKRWAESCPKCGETALKAIKIAPVDMMQQEWDGLQAAWDRHHKRKAEKRGAKRREKEAQDF